MFYKIIDIYKYIYKNLVNYVKICKIILKTFNNKWILRKFWKTNKKSREICESFDNIYLNFYEESINVRIISIIIVMNVELI